LIFSIKDSFYTGDKPSAPLSLYLTWHIANKPIAYSYSVFNETTSPEMFYKLQSFLFKKTDALELFVPDFSGEKYIFLKLYNNFFDKSNESKFFDHLNSKKHFWQFLYSDYTASGFIETVDVSKSIMNIYTQKPSKFHDVYLKKKLIKTSTCRVEFKNSHIYCDHNFGYEPLYKIKDHWYWWHIESSQNWEVIYYFPKQEKAFYISKENQSKTIDLKLDKTILKYGINNFLVKFPKQIQSIDFGRINFIKKIESAPFYLRITSKSETSSISATMEALIPSRIYKWVNKTLMSARISKIIKPVFNVQLLERNINFQTACKNITKKNSKSFYFASKVLSHTSKENAYFVYTLCRLIDDATDSSHIELSNIASNIQVGSQFSNDFLNSIWNNKTDIDSNLLCNLKDRLNYCLFIKVDNQSAEDFLRKSRLKIHNEKIEKKLFEDLLLGQKMDESFKQPKNFKEFYHYCYCVAGAVGLLMAKIFKVQKDHKAFQSAEHLGIAMQITNILRDVKEDYEMDRVYLPKDFCESHALTFSNSLFNDIDNQKIAKKALILSCSNTSVYYYESAIAGISYISHYRDRFCVKLMAAMYAAILGKIQKNPLQVFKKRVSVTKLHKCIIFLKVFMGFHPLSAAGVKRNQNPQNQEFYYEKV